MKFRCDFVTNSSSSSFLLAFASKDDGTIQIANMDTYAEIRDTLLRDFLNADPISPDEIETRFHDELFYSASSLVDCAPDGWHDSQFQIDWKASHPDAKYIDYHLSPERKAKMEEIAASDMKDLKDEIAGRPYLVEIEYEDHTRVGADLEHEVLPYQPFTVRRFSHH